MGPEVVVHLVCGSCGEGQGCVHPGVSAPGDVGDCKWAAVGSLLVLAPDFASCGTAGQGPLSLGQLGIVLVNTGLEVHVKVYPDGGITWPYVGSRQ